jgi:Flp pilus assembly protein TadB
MALLGGSLAAGTHFTKAGTRAIINASPEPFTNVAASVGEDVVVLTGLWLMFTHPWLMLALLALLVAVIAWLLPKLWRGVVGLVRGFSLPRWSAGSNP